MNDIDPQVLTIIGRTMRTMEIESTPQKRAMLVRSKEDNDLLDTFIGGTLVGWPWRIFLDLADALEWLQD